MINLQKKMQELFGNTCCGYAYAYLAGYRGEKDLTHALFEGWRCGYIEDDGYVALPVLYLRRLGLTKAKDVIKIGINSLDELPKGMYVVEYSLNGSSHFVVAEDNKVVFDSAGESKAVALGKPVSYRMIIT